jgi:terminase large subunit-like protein
MFQLEFVNEVFAGYREVLAVLPTGSYKTTTAGGLGLYHLLYYPDDSPQVPIGAAAKDQAAIIYEQASGFVSRTPGLKKRFRVQDGYRRILCPSTSGRMRVYSAKDQTGDGIIPTLPMLDELHRHKGHDLYGTWRDKLTKRDGTMLVLSTAGDDENNPVEQLRDAAHRLPNIKRRGRHTVARSDGREFVMHEYALREKDDPDDLELVKQANPANQVTIEELRMRRDSPSTKKWHWLRFTCNVRTKGEESAIDPDDYDRLVEADLAPAPGLELPRFAWMDLGWKIDTTAIGMLSWERQDRRVVSDVTVLEPPVDESDIVVCLLTLQERYGEGDFRGIVYDPNAGGRQMAQLLEKGEHPLQYDDDARDRKGLEKLGERVLEPLIFIDHSQDNAPMALAASRLDEAIRNRWIVLPEHPKLRRHFLNAVWKPLGGEKQKFDRPANQLGEGRRKYPIDGLTGVLMGHSVAVGELDEPKQQPPTDLANYRIRTI